MCGSVVSALVWQVAWQRLGSSQLCMPLQGALTLPRILCMGSHCMILEVLHTHNVCV